jgi:hypothetical protein
MKWLISCAGTGRPDKEMDFEIAAAQRSDSIVSSICQKVDG